MYNFNDIKKNKEYYLDHLKKLKNDNDYKNKYADFLDKRIKEYWMELKPFNVAEDIPNLPKNLNEFYINKLIELGSIPKNKLTNEFWYYGNYRITNYGRWDEKNQVFHIIRFKFNQHFMEQCNHFENDDGFALFVPLRAATLDEIENQERLIKKIKT